MKVINATTSLALLCSLGGVPLIASTSPSSSNGKNLRAPHVSETKEVFPDNTITTTNNNTMPNNLRSRRDQDCAPCVEDGGQAPSSAACYDCCNCRDNWKGVCKKCDNCFSSQSQVFVEGIGEVAMEDLNVGDRVLVSGGGKPQPTTSSTAKLPSNNNNNNNNNKYETVYDFGDYSRNSDGKFLQIYTAGQDKPLEITSDHLVYVQGKPFPIAAADVQVGDTLVGGDSAHQPPKVSKISSVKRKGYYAPLTVGGNIVVDGIKASCYNSQSSDKSSHATDIDHGLVVSPMLFSWHLISHVWLAPRRLLCLGVSLKLCQPVEEQDGMEAWADAGEQVARFYEKQGAVVRALVLATFFAVLLPILAVEQTLLRPSLLLLALVTTFLGVYLSGRQNGAAKRKQA